MKHGDLALYVHEIEKCSSEELEKRARIKDIVKGVGKAFGDAGRAVRSAAKAGKSGSGKIGPRGKSRSLKERVSSGASEAKKSYKKEWGGMSGGAKAATIGTAATGVASAGYGLKKMID